MSFIPLDIIEQYAEEKPAFNRAYLTLRAAALAGRFNNDARCTENELSRELGMSRTPIRRALDLLGAEGITLNLRRNDREFDPEEKTDILMALASLEGQAAAKAAALEPKDWISLLVELNENMASYASDASSVDVIRDLDLQFHLLLAKRAQSDYLYSEISRIRVILRKYHAQQGLLTTEKTLFQVELYRHLIEALQQADPHVAELWARAGVVSTLWMFKKATLS